MKGLALCGFISLGLPLLGLTDTLIAGLDLLLIILAHRHSLILAFNGPRIPPPGLHDFLRGYQSCQTGSGPAHSP